MTTNQILSGILAGTYLAVAFFGSAAPLRAASPRTQRKPLLIPVLDRGTPATAFSPDGRTVATGGADGKLCLWDPRTGHLKGRWQAGKGTVCGLAFSRNGRLLVDEVSVPYAVDEIGRAQVWDVRTHHLRWSCPASGLQNGVALSPDGRTLAVGSGLIYRLPARYHARRSAAGGGGVRLWDLHTGKLVRPLYAENNPFYGPAELQPPLLVDHLCFSPNGRKLAGIALFGGGCAEPQFMQRWGIRSGQLQDILRLPGDDEEETSSVAYSSQGSLVAVSHYTGLYLWDAPTGRLRKKLTDGSGGSFGGLCFSPDGSRVAGGSNPVTIWDTRTGKVVRRILPQVRGTISLAFSPVSLAFSPDGRTLAVGTPDGRLGLWPVL